MHFEDSEPGLGALAAAVVIGAVASILLVGAVVMIQRQQAIESGMPAVAVGVSEETPLPSVLGTPAPTPPADAPGQYTVRPGDSLFSVAAELGLSPNELVYWNAEKYPTLESTPALRPGWVLRTTGPPLPTATPQPTASPTPDPVLAEPAVPGLPTITAASFPASDRVTLRWYEVAGSNPGEIFGSILTNGPYSEWIDDTATAHVEVRPSFNFYFQTGPVGYCAIVPTRDPAVSITYEVVLPAWSPDETVSIAPGTVEWWAAELESTVAHEARHITLYEEHLPAMQQAVGEGTCESAEDDLLAAWSAAVLANCEFDMAEYGTASGLSLGACVAEGS